MNGSQDLFQQALTMWNWEPSILIGMGIWIGGYFWLTRPGRRNPPWGRVPLARKLVFSLGTLVALLALITPIDYIADNYLFSAHMIQHLLLIMVVPPLWLLGLPDDFIDGLKLPGWAEALIGWVTRPAVAFLIFNAVLLIWHVPALYEATLENEGLHIFEHLLFMGTAMVGWWPVLGRSNRVAPQLSRPLQVLYMFLMMFPSTLLGAIITFARQPLIPFYATAPRLWQIAAAPGQAAAPAGASAGWGLSVMDDQQAAGLLMWIPGNMVYMGFLFYFLYTWLNEMDRETGEHFE